LISISWNPPLNRVRVEKDSTVLVAWYKRVAEEGHRVLLQGTSKPGQGRKYAKYPNRSSAPGAWPARQSGALQASARAEASAARGVLGVGVKYGAYLQKGTSRMAPRKLVYEALKIGLQRDGGRTLGAYLKWKP
jgi:hypothetical protein